MELKWLHRDSHASDTQLDVEIPVDVDPSQTLYYPDLEPHLSRDEKVRSHGNVDCLSLS